MSDVRPESMKRIGENASGDLYLSWDDAVKNAEERSRQIRSPTNRDKNACENTMIPGAKYRISNCGARRWNRE